MAYLLRSESIRLKFIYLAQGISRYNISKNGVMNIDILYPKKSEQILIGKLFRNLENLITLHQRKFDTFNDLKKAYLSKIFPTENKRNPEISFNVFY